MRTRTRNPFLTVRTEGSILPADVLSRIIDRDKDLGGLSPESYHLAKNERINEVATRAWNRLQGAWESFQEAAERLPEGDLATTLTRERWLQVLFQELGYGRLMTHRAWEIDGRTYPISHLWGNTPIHLVGCRVKMDTKQAGVAGAARVSPHSLVQEFLNRSDEHLWGIVSNGLILRLLRDNVSLTRQAYVEFDLDAMMEGEAFSDFVLLFMLCHQSRVEVPEDKTPESCWLERWHNAAAEQGIRALDTLRAGVQQAINTLGAGFLTHPANTGLRGKLKDGVLSTQDYYRQILRVVYRLLFLFVAEDRDLLYDPDAPLENRKTYADYYSTRRIRNLAQRRRGRKHADLYRSLCLVFGKLRAGCPELALPALGSFLFSDGATPDLDAVDLANRDLLEAMRKLACTTEGNTLRPIDYRNLGPEELGSVYESLLEMHPQVNTDAATFKLDVAAGNERKTTGSFYTHSSLVQCLLDSALDPVLDEAVKKSDPERALLDLKICDPASGSGHFLIAAAHRVAKRLAAVRTGEDEPSPDATRSALRDVIGRCIYGVDINPMAVELCKISLWMEAMEPGKALGFLDHHIKCGNSLLGTTPALMANGIPDDAFKPIEGDDKVVCKDLKAQNKKERAGQMALGEILDRHAAPDLTKPFQSLVDEDDSSVTSREKKAEHYRALVQSPEYQNAWFLADAWCAAFVLPKTSLNDLVVTHRRFRTWEADPEKISQEAHLTIRRIADEYQLFHWHLAFPEVFQTPDDEGEPGNEQCGWSGGFDCVLGNPPWEQEELEENEWFASRNPTIAEAPTQAERKKLIAQLLDQEDSLHVQYLSAKRRLAGVARMIVASGRYPLCAHGRTNTFSIFAELNTTIIRRQGQVGCVVPTGIATDYSSRMFFAWLIDSRQLRSLYDFHNSKRLFPDVRPHQHFCLLTVGGERSDGQAWFAFSLGDTADLAGTHARMQLSASDILIANPNTRTCPLFQRIDDLLITEWVYTRLPILLRETEPEENPWEVSFKQGLFNVTSDSQLFKTEEALEAAGYSKSERLFAQGKSKYVPLFDPKMAQQFNHRSAKLTFSGHHHRKISKEASSLSELQDPEFFASPVFHVPVEEVDMRLGEWKANWILGFKDVTGVTSMRLGKFAIIPRLGVGNAFPLMFSELGPKAHAILLANLNGLVTEQALRLKIQGLHLNFYYLKQVPILAPADYSRSCPWNQCQRFDDWTVARVLELTYTAWDLESFAEDCGFDAPPFTWGEQRRFLIRCELDTAFFLLYLGTPQEWGEQGSKELLEYFPTPRDAVEYIMGTFPIMKRKDEAEYGEYRTKLQILDIYDRMQHAIDTGEPYQTLLDPPPGPPADEHGHFLPLPEWKPGHPKPANWPSHIHPPKEVTEYDAN